MSHAALLEAIRAGQGEIALRMLAQDERLCVKLDDPSALMLAYYRHLPDVALAITARRPSLSVFEAATSGNLPELTRALANDAEASRVFAGDGFTALHLASFFGHAEAVAMLLQAGAAPNAQAGNATLVCPLHGAAMHGGLEVSRALLQAGADPNLPQQGGYVPLHAAALRDDVPLVTLLLAWGADRAIAADDGWTPLAIAHHNGCLASEAVLRR